MLTFRKHGPEAEKQMRAVIFYLTTFGYIDGDFDEAEKEYVRGYVRKLVEHRVSGVGRAVAGQGAAERQGRRHGVLLMVELGDLREGILPQDLSALAQLTLGLPSLRLVGIGSNERFDDPDPARSRGRGAHGPRPAP